jgi:hypothetical protein
VAHTCFNALQIVLPRGAREMESALLVSMRFGGEGFDDV